MHPRSYGFPAGPPADVSFLGVPLPLGSESVRERLPDGEGGRRGVLRGGRARAACCWRRLQASPIDHARRVLGVAESRRGELRRPWPRSMRRRRSPGPSAARPTSRRSSSWSPSGRGRWSSARALVIELRRTTAWSSPRRRRVSVPAGLVGRRDRRSHQSRREHARCAPRSTLRLEDAPNRARFERYGLGRLGLTRSPALSCRWCSAGGATAPWSRSTGSRTVLPSARTTSACSRPSLRARRPRSRRPSRPRPSSAASGSRRPSRSGRAGLASSTMRRSRAWRRCGCASRGNCALAHGPEGNARGDRRRRSRSSTTRSPALRALITELRPVALDDLGLAAAIEALGAGGTHPGPDLALDVALAGEQARPGPPRHRARD